MTLPNDHIYSMPRYNNVKPVKIVANAEKLDTRDIISILHAMQFFGDSPIFICRNKEYMY
jgi:hypothetical protein